QVGLPAVAAAAALVVIGGGEGGGVDRGRVRQQPVREQAAAVVRERRQLPRLIGDVAHPRGVGAPGRVADEAGLDRGRRDQVVAVGGLAAAVTVAGDDRVFDRGLAAPVF